MKMLEKMRRITVHIVTLDAGAAVRASARACMRAGAMTVLRENLERLEEAIAAGLPGGGASGAARLS